MNEGQNKEGFRYRYSAKEQNEVERIRQKYLPDEGRRTGDLETLRRLDASVTRGAVIWALTLGILGVLVMGFGMSLTLVPEFGESLGFSDGTSMVVGVAVGLVGMVVAGLAYPIYSVTVKRRRERMAPEVLRLTEELMK